MSKSIYRISNASGQGDVQCLVTLYANQGNVIWYTLPLDYSDTEKSDWYRKGGWECVSFKDQAGKRRGFYLYCPVGITLELKFHGFERDLGLRYVSQQTGAEEVVVIPA